ncbi:MAG: endonuclease MutS2, partial [Bacteroidetes bacterium]|nr:endonuclease MutS2 [Bacteroidota bacterium]
MIYPKNLEKKIGFDLIRDRLSSYCDTSLGKEECYSFSFSSDIAEIRIKLEETQEFTELLSFERSFEWYPTQDLREALKTASVPGIFLNLEDFVSIRENYRSVKKILTFFSKTKPEQYPRLKYLTKSIQIFPFIQDKLDQIISKTGQIRDNASQDLLSIRKSISQKNNNLSRRIKRIVDQAQSDGWVDQDTSPTIREGRLVIPVPAANKRKLSGLIHDESATGKTVFIEPVEMVELNNEIRALEIAEGREIIKILQTLTDSLRPYFDDILTWPVLIAAFDFIRAKSKLSKEWEGRAIALADEELIDWRQVRHPLLVLTFKKEGKKVIAQDIQLNQDDRILLISGPNAGGKSVCLKTVGLVQYLIQCGLLPPLAEGSVTRIFEQIFIDIGDEQSIENDLSTYSSHLLNMKYFLRSAGPDSLMLIDEFGTGTEPQLGAALAQAMLRQLNATGGYGVITTHYSNLKHFAAHEPGIINGAMLYDAQKFEPLFQLEIGKPGSSFAFEIARKIGLPDAILDEAKNEVGTDTIMFDKHLREISRDKRYWENKRKKIRKSEKQLEDLILNYEAQIKDMEKQRKQDVKNARKESEDLLNKINKRIENTIHEIRTHQAEKEKTKEARKSLESFKDSVAKDFSQQEDNIGRDVDELKRKQQSVRRKTGIKAEIIPDVDEKKKELSIIPGQKVRIWKQGTVGEVLKVNPSSILLSIGEMMTTMPREDLEIISEKEYKSSLGYKTTGTASSAFFDLDNRRLN